MTTRRKIAAYSAVLAILSQPSEAAKLASPPITVTHEYNDDGRAGGSDWYSCSIQYLGNRTGSVKLAIFDVRGRIGGGSGLTLTPLAPTHSFSGECQGSCREMACVYTVTGDRDDYRASTCVTTRGVVRGEPVVCMPAY
jgi:hypothetical protein